MRIAHLTATFPPYRGGTGNVCLAQASELVRRGHDTLVITAAHAAAGREIYGGVTVVRVRPIARVGNAPLLPGLAATLAGRELVHLHYPFYGGELAALAAQQRGAALVVTYHQDVILGGLLGAAEWLLRHTLGRAVLRAAERVLFTSHDYAAASHIRPLLRGREAQTHALPNGVDPQRFASHRSHADMHTRYHLPAGAPIVLLVAGLDRPHAFKGVTVFLEALAQLPYAAALIVGDGELRSGYQQHAAALGLRGRVAFAGRVSDGDLPGYYQSAALTVLPSTTMGEAFGLVLLESLAAGTPVVASDLPGVRTVVDHGRDGLLVLPGDPRVLAGAIGALLSSSAAGRRSWGARGRARAATYDWLRVVGDLERVYGEAHDARRRRRS